jgi:hypothetical protein
MFPYKDIAQREDFAICIALPVVDELDQQKSDRDPWIQKRARAIITKLRGLGQSATKDGLWRRSVDPATGLVYLFYDWEPPGSNDPAILAAALSLTKEGHQVAILTGDHGMEVKAASRGVDVLAVPEELWEPGGGDVLASRIKQLEKQVEAQNESRPQIEVTLAAVFPVGGPTTEIVRIDRPTEAMFRDLSERAMLGLGRAIPILGAHGPTYAAEVRRYQPSHEQYLKERWEREALGIAAVRLRFVLKNLADSALREARLRITAPPGVTFVYPPKKKLLPPAPPAAPLPSGPLDYLTRFEPVMPLISAMGHIQPVARRQLVQRVSPTELLIDAGQDGVLRPFEPSELSSFWMALKSDFGDEDVTLAWVAYSSATPISGTVTLPIEHRHQPWQAPDGPTPTRKGRWNPEPLVTVHDAWIHSDAE